LRLIGDVIFTTPAIRAIRRRYPEARLTYLVERAAAPIVAHNPHLDEVIVADRPRGLARLVYDVTLARRLRRARFDVVVDFHGGPRSAWLAFATGARRRIGYAVPGRGWLYTTRVPWSPDLLPPRHSVSNQSDLLATLDVGAPEPARDPVEMVEDPSAALAVTARLAAAGVPPDASLVVIHVSAGNPFRRWPAASFAEVAATLAMEDPARRIIITSGPSESSAASEVADQARRRVAQLTDAAGAELGATAGAELAQERIVRCGEFALAELRALAARAALYIGGDSGPMHVASTTRVPIVALLGPTLPERSMPWRDPAIPSRAVDAGPLPCRPCHQRHCEPGDFRCLTSISPARVLEAARELLGK
jgi:ADP-heptose:LPS heptosyltransferase